MSDEASRVSKVLPRPYSAETEPLSSIYDLYGHKKRSGRMCAVTLNHPIPGFMAAGEWQLIRTFEPTGAPPLGFDPSAASESMLLQGFHLFNLPTDDCQEKGQFGPSQELAAEQIKLHALTMLARINPKKGQHQHE